MKLTDKQIELVQQCKTPEELVSKAKEVGLVLSLEQAEKCLSAFSITELSEDDCDVASGGCGDTIFHCDGCDLECKGSFNIKNGQIYCEDCYKTLFPREYALEKSYEDGLREMHP